MKRLLLLSLWLAGVVAGEAAHVKLLSPDTAQTFAVGSLDDHNFTWNARTGQFGAILKFSNRPATKWREEESFRFVFPEVKFDAANQTFYALTSDNQRVPIAQLRAHWFGREIVPAPGTQVLVANEGGKVRLLLTADDHTQARGVMTRCWVERSDAFVLQNLLRDVTGAN